MKTLLRIGACPVAGLLAACGIACLVVGWNGDVVRARLRSGEAGLDTDMRYVIPEEGTLSWFDVLAIPKDAPHPEEAHAFIDFMLRADIGAENATSVRYATFNRLRRPPRAGSP